MGKLVTLDLMRVGKWKGFNITPKFIQQIANATKKRNYQNDQGPVVKGHPKHDSPSFGWWNKNNVAVAGNGHLQVQMSEDDFDSEFLTDLKSKKYGPISIALRPSDLSIKHIGFFGGTTTAVSGLKPAFSEADFEDKDFILEFSECNLKYDPTGIGETVIEFAEFKTSNYQLNSTENVFRNIKNFFISKFDLETADKVLPEHLLSNIKEPLRVWEVPQNDPRFSDIKIPLTFNNEEDMDPKELQILQDKAAKVDQLEADNKKFKTDLATATSSLQLNESEKRVNTALQFCESEDLRNKITPAMKNKVANTLAFLEAEEEAIQFSEDGKEVKVQAAEVFKDVLKMLPTMEFSEFAKNGETQKSDSLTEEAEKMAKEVNDEM